MLTVLAIIAAVVALLSCVLTRVIPGIILVTSLTLVIIGIAVITFLFHGPRDYMRHLPSALQICLHPWVLASISLLSLILGAASLVGFGIRKLRETVVRRSLND